jgi:hypothetical protein
VELLHITGEFVKSIPSPIAYLFIFFIGLFVFWRGCAEYRKNRSSVFDLFLISSFLSIVVARVVYIVLEWETFTSYIWYWIPYEKYGEKIYLFRLLPWRFLSIWDGGLVVLAIFVSLLLFMTFFSLVVKKWRWKHMFFPIYYASTTMLGVSFIYIGVNSGFYDWVYKGLILIGVLAIFFLFFKFIYKIVKNPLLEKYILGYVGLVTVWMSSIYIIYFYFSSVTSLLENAFVGIFLIWSLIMGVLFIIDLRKARVQIRSVSTVRSVSSR